VFVQINEVEVELFFLAKEKKAKFGAFFKLLKKGTKT
jgi:hypothetical protein